jgi:hypothetical protein
VLGPRRLVTPTRPKFPTGALRRKDWTAAAKSALVLASAIIGLALTGCFSPRLDIGDCVIPCNADCPTDFECRSGYCARQGSAARCESAGERGDAGPPSGSAGVLVIEDAKPRDSMDGGEIDAEDAAIDDRNADAGLAADADSGGSPGAPLCAECTMTPDFLPAPCSGNGYTAVLVIAGGSPPYSWQSSMPSGMALSEGDGDHSRARISGVPTDPANSTLQVVVTDAAGRQLPKTYDWVPRDKCWLAYVSLENGDPQLHVIDPLLKMPAPFQPANNHGVHDFQFSPDGRHLVYRFGAEPSRPSSGHLSLLNLSTWQEKALAFSEDSVVQYAWSDDAAVLAVAFQAPTGTYLGAVRFGKNSQEDASTPAAAGDSTGSPTDAETAAVSFLDAVLAPIQSPLLWFAANHLAFFGPTVLPDPSDPTQTIVDPDSQMAYYTTVESTRLRAPTRIATGQYHPPNQLRRADSGFFAISTADPGITFNEEGAPPILTQQGENFIAPSGAFTAGLSTDQLQVFRAVDDIADPPWANGRGCGKVLAWARDRERLACVTDVLDTVHGESSGLVTLFALDKVDPSTRTLPPAPVGGSCIKSTSQVPTANACGSEYDYAQAKATFRRRAFSPSGRWFAFATSSTDRSDDYLYWADMSSDAPQLKRKDVYQNGGTPESIRIELAFSPDENLVAQQRGTELWVHDLNAPQNTGEKSRPRRIGSGLMLPETCEENFAIRPDRWCGNVRNATSFAWSSDSKLVAFQAPGQFVVVDLSHFPSYDPVSFPVLDCDARCNGMPIFQP